MSAATICSIPGCGRPRSQSRPICAGHEYRRRKGLPMNDPPLRSYQPRSLDRVCSLDGCRRTAKVSIAGRRVCMTHYGRHASGMPDWDTRPLPPVRGRSKHAKKPLAVITLRLSDAHLRQLTALAEARNIERGTLARQAVEAWLAAAQPSGRIAAATLDESTAWARRALEWDAV